MSHPEDPYGQQPPPYGTPQQYPAYGTPPQQPPVPYGAPQAPVHGYAYGYGQMPPAVRPASGCTSPPR